MTGFLVPSSRTWGFAGIVVSVALRAPEKRNPVHGVNLPRNTSFGATFGPYAAIIFARRAAYNTLRALKNNEQWRNWAGVIWLQSVSATCGSRLARQPSFTVSRSRSRTANLSYWW